MDRLSLFQSVRNHCWPNYTSPGILQMWNLTIVFMLWHWACYVAAAIMQPAKNSLELWSALGWWNEESHVEILNEKMSSYFKHCRKPALRLVKRPADAERPDEKLLLQKTTTVFLNWKLLLWIIDSSQFLWLFIQGIQIAVFYNIEIEKRQQVETCLLPLLGIETKKKISWLS